MNSTSGMRHINKDCLLKCGDSIQNHRTLLIKIGRGFGFSTKQCEDFMQEIYTNADGHHLSWKMSGLSFRLYLSKMMVYKCIFKISEKLCSQDNSGASKSTIKYSDLITTYSTKLQHMPLTYTSVYVLNNIGEFTESEIAQLLNITPLRAIKGGTDPVVLFKKHPGRFPLWHVKDLDKERNTILPVGEGTIDFKPIFKAAATAGMQYYFVEHDMPADPFKSITTSIKNLKNVA